MSEDNYNGWSNYETWCVNLWIHNDEPLYRAAYRLRDQVQARGDEALDDTTRDTFVEVKLGGALQDFVVANMPSALHAAIFETNSMFSDMFTHTLQRVDYREIAAAMLSDD